MVFVVAITGASSGLGAELALQCAKRGYNVALIARTEEKLKAVKTLCEELYQQGQHSHSKTTYHVADVSKFKPFEQAFHEIVDSHGRVDVLVNNAGKGIQCSTLDLTEEDFDEIMAVNTKSVLFGMQIAANYFQSLDLAVGHIINVSSVLGRTPTSPQRSVYCAAKHAVNSLTSTTRTELAQLGYGGIIVSGFHPGLMATDFGLNAINGTTDSRKGVNPQPVDEAAGIMLDMIDEAQKHIQSEVKRIVNGGSADDGVFPEDGSKFYDVYSRPGYKQDVLNYLSADDLGRHERQIQAKRREDTLRQASENARRAAGLQ